MGGIGWQEILLVFVVVLLLFGAKRIPDLARSLGKASREFKRARDGFTDELKSATDPEKKPDDQEHDADNTDAGAADRK